MFKDEITLGDMEQKRMKESYDAVRGMFEANPGRKFTIKDVSDRLNKPGATTNYYIRILHREGFIERDLDHSPITQWLKE